MSCDECGAVPRQIRVRVAVEMDQIRLQTVLEMQQPVAGVLHVGPAVGHPLEFVVAFEEVEIGDTAGVVGLSGAQRWSHRSEQDFDAVRLEGANSTTWLPLPALAGLFNRLGRI